MLVAESAPTTYTHDHQTDDTSNKAPTNKICRRASSEQRPRTRSCHESECLVQALFRSNVPFGKSFFPRSTSRAAGNFSQWRRRILRRSIKVSHVLLCLWLVPSHLTCLLWTRNRWIVTPMWFRPWVPHDDKDQCMWPKRPMHMTKETYILRARDVWSPRNLLNERHMTKETDTEDKKDQPHKNRLGTQLVSNPATRKDLAARTWGVFWY